MFLLVLVLSVLGIGFCHEEFQCEFKNKDLKFSKHGYYEGYAWGNWEVPPLTFADVDEMDKFIKDLNEVRREFYANAVYNDVESFRSDLIALDGNETDDYITWEKEDRFIREYVPPIESSQTNLGLLVQFLRSLGQKLNRPDIGKHVYIALKGEDLSTKLINDLRYVGAYIHVAQFQYESLVGIIKVKHPKKGGGSLILNMDYPDDYVPLVLESDDPRPDQIKYPQAFEEYISTYHNNHLPISYTFNGPGNSKKYIEVNTWEKQKSNFYTTDVTNIIYTRPVCSVTEIQNRANLKSTAVRSIMKYGPDFTLEAYAFVRIGAQKRTKWKRKVNDPKEASAKDVINAKKTPKGAFINHVPAFKIGFTKDLTHEEYISLLLEANRKPKNMVKSHSCIRQESDDEPPPKDIVITSLDHLSEKDLVVMLKASKLLNTDLQVSLGVLESAFYKTDETPESG